MRIPEVDWERTYDNLRRLGAPYNIAFGTVTMLSNSRMALEASEYARNQGKYDLFSEKVFQAYFTEARDIGKSDVIRDLAAASGLDVKELQDALRQRRYAPRLRAAQDAGRRYNVSGVPTFVINEHQVIVGAQPLAVFRETIQQFG